MIGGESETGILGDGEDGLNEAFAESGFADDQCAIVILQGAGDDFSSRGCVSVDEDDDRELRTFFAVGGTVDLVGEGAAALGDDDLALLEELVRGIDGFIEEAAGVAAEIEDEAVDIAEAVERIANFAAGGLNEAGDVNVPIPGRIRKARSIEGRGISSRTRSKTMGRAAPSRLMVTETCVPLAPLRREATPAVSMPSVDLPSTVRISSPGRIPAL